VELDYVTFFLNHGCRRVVTSPGMLSPYCDRLGFRREGDSYVLELAAARLA
jgi:hypothetical protein